MVENRLQQYGFENIQTRDDKNSSLEESLRPVMDRASTAIGHTLRKYPLVTVIAGVAAGVVLGCLIKRR